MTGFGDADGRRTSAERRKQRMAEARRRVDSGEATPPPPPPPAAAPRSRSPRTSGRARAAAVDPSSTPGATFGVWRSVQHFCTTESIPDALSGDLDRIVSWSGGLQVFRLRQRIIARLDSQGTWTPVCYAKDGRRETITQAQADRYQEARLGEAVLSGGAQRPLSEEDHPEVTVSL